MSEDFTAQMAWYNLERAVEAVQECERSGAGDYHNLLNTVRAAILLLLEHPDPEVLAQARGSALPLRPTVSWLLFEAGRIQDIPGERVDQLRRYWDEHLADEHGALMPPPPTYLGL